MPYTSPSNPAIGDPTKATWGQTVKADLDDHQTRITALESGGGTGDVVGPASSTDNEIPRYNGTTGKLLQGSGVTIPDGQSATLSGTNTGDVTLAGALTYLTIAGQVITRGLIDLVSHVTGRLPFANLTAAPAANRLLGRGSAGGAGDWESIALGAGLNMSGTTLSAPGGGGAATLDDLTDVAVTTPASNDVLQYDGAGWVNRQAQGLNASNLASGTVPAARMPALTGDITTSAGAVATTLKTAAKTRAIGTTIVGAGAAITAGVKAEILVPYDCTIQQVTLLADQSGSIVIDIWKDTYANYPPTVADTITASAKPTITSALKSQDGTLTGWTTAITAGDILRFNVDSCTAIQRVTLILKAAV